MLTPVSKKKSKKAKSARERAKDIILKKALVGPQVGEQTPPDQSSTQTSIDTGDNAEAFTPEELNRLDFLFDILSWIICLFTGAYDKMNVIGDSIGLKQLDAETAKTFKQAMQEQIPALTAKCEALIDSDSPISAEDVSDIENTIRAKL